MIMLTFGLISGIWRGHTGAPVLSDGKSKHLSTHLCGFLYLELPMCRLEKLLRLVRRATRRQDELVNHHLMFKFFHFRPTPCPTGGDWLTFDRFPLFRRPSCALLLHLSRPPLQPGRANTNIYCGSVKAALRDWQAETANQRRAGPLGVGLWERVVACRRGLYRLLTLSFTKYVHICQIPALMFERI